MIRIPVRRDFAYASRGRTVLAMNRDGFVDEGRECGLFVHETRMLSRYRMLVDGEPLDPCVHSNVDQHAWLGYYLAVAPGIDTGTRDRGSGQLEADSQHSLELRTSRVVGEGMHDDLALTNYTEATTRFRFAVEIDADFADLVETGRRRCQRGRITRDWREVEAGRWELSFRYEAAHTHSEQGESGRATIRRGVIVRVDRASSPPSYEGGQIAFDVELGPRGTWGVCLVVIPIIEEVALPAPWSCFGARKDGHPYNTVMCQFMAAATRFDAACAKDLTHTVLATVGQAERDLAALRLHDLDVAPTSWTVSAGVPIYVALFGRDVLTASWQAALLGPEMLRGSLGALARWQGVTNNDWRDEQPGRMLHEAHTGPLEALHYNSRARSYGSVTTSGFFPFVLAQLWHWTGDRELVRSLLPSALKALEWVDRHGDIDGDGFYEYLTRSRDGVKHQAWKDSPDAIVYEDGGRVEPPIATCEEQAFVYVAKLAMSEVLWSLGDRDDARRLFREARELKQRFNDVFWMEDESFVALALDAEKRQVRSIASNAGHCMAAGLIDTERVPAVARRLMQRDLFNGWGVRTLSSDHPAYNPYSYHRGSIWPVEQATFALGLFRYGEHASMHRLVRAQFEAAELFDHYRLPEVFSGHARSAAQPFPALYPRSNPLQAWSSSAVICLVQALVGIYPYAPLHTLIVDPHLPEWLPEMVLRRLRVGEATVTVRFFRTADGSSDYRILEQRGRLHVIRQPSPWSLSAGLGERVGNLLSSFAPGR